VRLSEARAGQRVRVTAIRDGPWVSEAAALGLAPGIAVLVVRTLSSGPTTVRMDGRDLDVGPRLADAIDVVRDDKR
jgi:Fe2+ transport system protein FeoA